MAEIAEMSLEASTPKMDQRALIDFGQSVFDKFQRYKSNRYATELTWLANLRQFKGIWDPTPASEIPLNRSQAYPKITRHKVVGMVARLMEMLFPAVGRNWDAKVSPVPDLEESVANSVIEKLYQDREQRAQAALETGEQVAEITVEDCEKALVAEAERRAERMRVKMDDQLAEMDYVSLARRVVLSAVIYNCGVLKGPLTRAERVTTVLKDSITGRCKAVRSVKNKPFFEFLPCWNFYPDMSARELTPEAMDGHFERHILSRAGVEALREQPGFFGLNDYLRDNPNGNFPKEEHWEAIVRMIGKDEAQRSDRTSIQNPTDSKYEYFVWWGTVPGTALAAAGAAISEEDKGRAFEGNVHMLGKTVVKAIVSPLSSERVKRKIRPAHVFVFEEDDVSLLGTGLPPIIRDSQMAVANASRALLDNASVTSGPNIVVDTRALVPGQTLEVRANKVWQVDHSQLSNGRQPIYAVNFDAHINELSAVIQMFRDFADTEASLPPALSGDIKTGSEAFRTSTNVSQLLGAAAMPIRDTVRNYDRFTESVMLSLYLWNMEFDDDADAKGDFTIVTMGATTLIAKEVRGTALDYLATTLSPDERIEVDTRKLLVERMKARDVPESVLRDPKEAERMRENQAAQMQRMDDAQFQQMMAEIQAIKAAAIKDVSVANKAAIDANARVVDSLVSGLAATEDKPAAKVAA